jgi:addiction module HigA family antidote
MGIPRTQNPAWSVHPGEILREEFLEPLKMSVYELAKKMHVDAQRINPIVLEKRAISPDTAVLLAKVFETSEMFWMNLQAAYDLHQARTDNRKKLESIEPVHAHAHHGD